MTETYSIVIAGDGGVGKSSITLRFVNNVFVDKYNPSLENSYRKTLEVDSKIFMLEITDTAGQEEFRSIRDFQLNKSDGFILVYSLFEKSTLDEISSIRDKILLLQNLEKDDLKTKKVPIVIAGNKVDLEKDQQREVYAKETKELSKSWGIPFYETSAKENINIDILFIQCVRRIRQYKQKPVPSHSKKFCLIL
ncbi:ras di-ras and rheb family members of small gtpase superfamily [Anaeramoeba ignava]|uniref:Ras di-ras and rheb family members of small gtpase superfamily n=1 Tax=Anaeramoeba ignava TaxID=1746090 RepID=A0A9Q0LQE8_ANAIG|nr:ras di-ras and rheb family members of small gtpase superfamily [Anaeramoeba ignava]